MDDFKYRKYNAETELISNNEGKHIFTIKNSVGHDGWQEQFACTVGELKKMLEQHQDSDYVKFTGRDSTDDDYGPNIDERGMAIVSLLPFNEHEQFEIEAYERQKVEDERLRKLRIAETEKKRELEQLEYLKKKYNS